MTAQEKSIDTPLPSTRTIWGLNGLIFYISDVRHGVGPLLSIYLKGFLGWDSASIGLSLSMLDVTGIFTQIPAGYIIDASRRKLWLISLSCLCIVLGCLIIISFPFLGAILFAQGMMGIATSFISPAISAVTLGLFGKEHFPKRVTRNEMWNHSGNVVTALTAGIAGYYLGYPWLFYAIIGFAFASIASLSFIRSKEINHDVARELILESSNGINHPKPLPIPQLFKRMPIIIFSISLILYYMGNAAQIALIGQILVNQYPHHEFLFFSGSMIIAELVMTVMAVAIGMIINRIGRKPLLLTAFFLVASRALLFNTTSNPYLLLSIQILDGMAAGIMSIIFTVITSDLAVKTGRFNFLLGFFAVSISVGAAISNTMAGYIVKYFGFHAGFLTLACVALLGAAFFALLMPETKKLD